MLPPIVTLGMVIGMIVTFIIAVSTGSAALAEVKKGTKPSANPLKGEIISFSVFCCVCLILMCILKMTL
jgi:xanthine/uracil permease